MDFMVWLICISTCAISLLGGRAYSRYLDEIEASPIRQFLSGTYVAPCVEDNPNNTQRDNYGTRRQLR
jgi:hypothetical protein